MKILFVCKSNIGRSPMAETFFIKFSKKNEVISAGTQVFEKEGEKIGKNEKAKLLIKVMNEEGINLSNNKVKQITPEMVKQANKIIVMAKKSECPDYLLKSKKVIFWHVEDIKGRYHSYDYHIKTKDKIKRKVKKLIKELN